MEGVVFKDSGRSLNVRYPVIYHLIGFCFFDVCECDNVYMFRILQDGDEYDNRNPQSGFWGDTSDNADFERSLEYDIRISSCMLHALSC